MLGGHEVRFQGFNRQCFVADVINVIGPCQMILNGDTKVFG